MPTRFNISPNNVVPVLRHDIPAIKPGESFDFTDEEAETLGSEWVEDNPRRGLAAEREFKAKRDKKPAAAESETTEPAESGTNEGDQP